MKNQRKHKVPVKVVHIDPDNLERMTIASMIMTPIAVLTMIVFFVFEIFHIHYIKELLETAGLIVSLYILFQFFQIWTGRTVDVEERFMSPEEEKQYRKKRHLKHTKTTFWVIEIVGLIMGFSRSYVYGIGLVFLFGGIISLFKLDIPRSPMYGVPKFYSTRPGQISAGLIGIVLGALILFMAFATNSTYRNPYPHQ